MTCRNAFLIVFLVLVITRVSWNWRYQLPRPHVAPDYPQGQNFIQQPSGQYFSQQYPQQNFRPNGQFLPQQPPLRQQWDNSPSSGKSLPSGLRLILTKSSLHFSQARRLDKLKNFLKTVIKIFHLQKCFAPLESPLSIGQF